MKIYRLIWNSETPQIVESNINGDRYPYYVHDGWRSTKKELIDKALKTQRRNMNYFLGNAAICQKRANKLEELSEN